MQRLKKIQGRRKPSFSSSLCFPHHTTTDQLTTTLKTSTRASPLLLSAWLRGCASPPRHLKSDSLLGGAGRNIQPLGAAPRGGRGPSLASLAALGCSLTPVRYPIAIKTSHSVIQALPTRYPTINKTKSTTEGRPTLAETCMRNSKSGSRPH